MSHAGSFDNALIEYILSIPDEAGACGTKEDAIYEKYPFKRIIDEMPGGFFIYRADESEEIIYANKALFRIFGCGTEEEFRALTGSSFKGMVYPEDYQAVERSIKEQVIHSRYDLDYVEYRVTDKNGEIRWLEDYGHYMRSKGAGGLFYVFVGDVTKKKRRQQEVFQTLSQEHLRRLAMIEGLTLDYDSVFYADLDKNSIQAYRISNRFNLKFQNENQVCEYAGFDTEYLDAWVFPEDREKVARALTPDYIRERLAQHKNFRVNYRIVNQDRIEYLQLCIINVSRTERVSQIIIGYRSIDDDIRYEIERNEILCEALEQLKSANVAKNTFLSNMSHDIRTPMNAIVGFTALAQKHSDDENKVKGYLDMIEASGSQLLRLLNDVLEISRMEAGAVYVEEEENNLLEIVQEVQRAVLSRATAKDIEFSLDISGLKHKYVYTDAQKLKQILVRLSRNAIKYTEAGGKVEVKITELRALSNELTTYQFMVKDNGIGISESFMAHMYEPFERQRNTTLSGIYGTGLGLTIIKNLVDMMSGTIEAQSVEGEGSCFTVTFHFRIKEGQSSCAKEDDVPIQMKEQKKLLLVEDNEINLEIEVELLQDAGFLVDTAVNGAIAVEKVKNAKPGEYALVLMDIQMPVMDGYHAARAIRALENPALANIPIAALSANTFEEDRKMSRESGMNEHLAKPVNMPQLLKFIESVTEG
ncbi:MAG: response regulator [Lachnospiraceae bacterium]|nr:response regulator [Lachnospiraceae bacterium]